MATLETFVGVGQRGVGKGQGDGDDRKVPLWNYVIVLSRTHRGGCKRWQCNECGKAFNGSYSRVNAHLLHIIKIGVVVCTKVNKANEGFVKEQEAAERASVRAFVNPFQKGSSCSMAPPMLNIDYASCKRTKEMGAIGEDGHQRKRGS
eukprot:Gb_11743 [translate_table: standard]